MAGIGNSLEGKKEMTEMNLPVGESGQRPKCLKMITAFMSGMLRDFSI